MCRACSAHREVVMFDVLGWFDRFVAMFLHLSFIGVLAWLGALVSLAWITGAIRYIHNSRVGIAEKLFSFKGSIDTGLIAMSGQAGFQPRVLRGGLHFM